jgi:L-fuconolactonase
VFDAHAHVISDDLQRYPVTEAALEKRATLVREPFSSSRLLQEMARAGVAGALLVQRGQFYAYDNRYVCDTAAANPGRCWPVCAIDAR